jgi:uncharacterized protein YegP (UPF0339 family)
MDELIKDKSGMYSVDFKYQNNWAIRKLIDGT